jgi:hypothetical protein
MSILSKTTQTILIKLQQVMETISLNKTKRRYVQENNGTQIMNPKSKRRFSRNLFHRSDGVHCSELLGFRTLSIVWYSKKLENNVSETGSISVLR